MNSIDAECIVTLQLPIKEINRIYDEARKTSQFYPTFNLADNPWNCDNCSFLPEFQVRLWELFLGERQIYCQIFDIGLSVQKFKDKARA